MSLPPRQLFNVQSLQRPRIGCVLKGPIDIPAGGASSHVELRGTDGRLEAASSTHTTNTVKCGGLNFTNQNTLRAKKLGNMSHAIGVESWPAIASSLTDHRALKTERLFMGGLETSKPCHVAGGDKSASQTGRKSRSVCRKPPSRLLPVLHTSLGLSCETTALPPRPLHALYGSAFCYGC